MKRRVTANVFYPRHWILAKMCLVRHHGSPDSVAVHQVAHMRCADRHVVGRVADKQPGVDGGVLGVIMKGTVVDLGLVGGARDCKMAKVGIGRRWNFKSRG